MQRHLALREARGPAEFGQWPLPSARWWHPCREPDERASIDTEHMRDVGEAMARDANPPVLPADHGRRADPEGRPERTLGESPISPQVAKAGQPNPVRTSRRIPL